MELKEWLIRNKLNPTIAKHNGFTTLTIVEEKSLLIESRNPLFEENFRLLMTEEELQVFTVHKCTSVLFCFGNNWYYSPLNPELVEAANGYYNKEGGGDQKQKKVTSRDLFEEIGYPTINLVPYKYIGRARCSEELIDSQFTHLGVHGGYELLNGSRSYDDWCKKAKFLNIRSLGICERNTLAGTLAFQLACDKANIQPILGETVTVKLNTDIETFIEAKLFALTKKGWNNLLHINKHINVLNEEQYIDEDALLSYGKDIVFVWSSHNVERLSKKRAKRIQEAFTESYYQFDAVEFASSDTDHRFLIQQNALMQDGFLPPILLNDTYYLDREDAEVKKLLNKIDKNRALNQSNSQYLKDLDDVLDLVEPLFQSEDTMYDFIEWALSHANHIAEAAQFKIEIGKFRLPKYERVDDQLLFADNESFFKHLIQKGLTTLIPKASEHDKYQMRIEEELEVIKEGGFIDYFLILWDIMEFCKRENILTGIGRGSAGGSVIAYLLGIIKMNPLDYDLIFSRFLNKGRIKVSMPDIDSDFESTRRDEVKRYMEQRYGVEQVCSIGTYGTLKLRAALQELGRLEGIDASTRRYMSKILDGSSEHWVSLFQTAMQTPELKNFIQKHATMINQIPLLLNQPKNASVHAAGVIVVPKEDEEGNPMTVFDWLPIKKMDGILISEWEGPQCEIAGFLKEDILGLAQLDKFKQIFDLIESNTGKRLSLSDTDIPLNDKNVYQLFHEGYNSDLFHFGSPGLKGYSQDVKPVNIEDLIAMMALYRPGVMEGGYHNTFVKIRKGKEEPSYDFMLEEVSKDTYGIYIYQEQVMKACQVIGDFTEMESDDVRRAMGKKKLKDMLPYKLRFIEKAVAKGCAQDQAEEIWKKLELFAGYGFNKSHAAAYAITGYKGQWLKYHYPMEYWSVALSNASSEELSGYISEINKLQQGITIAAPDINKSSSTFKPDFETGKIYWSLNVRQVGAATLEAIEEEKALNGNFYSFEEFVDRMPRNKCKKNQIFNLILAGTFDEIEHVKKVQDRIKVIKLYERLLDDSIPEAFQTRLILQEHFWLIRQKELTGFGHLDYKSLAAQSKAFKDKVALYIDPLKFFTEEATLKKSVIVGGLIKEVVERKTKKNDKFANIVLEANDEEMIITVWSEVWSERGKEIVDHKGGIMLIDGEVSANSYHKKNTLQTTRTSQVVLI